MTLAFGVIWADSLYHFRIVEAFFFGLLFIAFGGATYLSFVFGSTLNHSVYLSGDSIGVSSWRRSQTFPLTPTMRAREKSVGSLIVIVIEDQGRTVAKYLPPLDRYKEIRSKGAGHYWQELRSHQSKLSHDQLA